MNPRDAIITALTPGSPFNPNGLVFRTVNSLRAFTELTTQEIMDLLAGDLAPQVACKPSKKPGKGIMVALKAFIPQPAGVEPAEQVVIAGGPAFNPPVPGKVEQEISGVVLELAVPKNVEHALPGVAAALANAFADDIDEAPDFDEDDL